MRKSEERREKALLAVTTKVYGERVFTRIDGKVILKAEDLRCPSCKGPIPEINAHLSDMGRILSNPNADLGEARKRSSDGSCSKCGSHHRLLTVLF